MNALPHIFHYDQPPDEPPKKPRWTWKRIVGWIIAGILILLILIALAIMVLLHSSKFHAYVLKTAQEKATAALGTPFQLKDYKLQFNGYNIKLDLYGMVVHGAPPYPDPPLLTVDHVTGSAHITSLLHRTWYITDINIEHPVARVFIDKQGKNNLPTIKSSSNSGGQTNLFDMGIRHALLSNGEVYFNDHKSALDADLHELTFSSGFDVAKKMYAGTMSYRNGHLRFGAFAPMPHDLDARFSADPNTFELPSAVLRSGNSQFSLTAAVHDYNSPQVQANYRATLDVTELRRIMHNATLPTGVVNTEGVLQYHAEPNRTMLDTMVVRGTVSSRALAVHTASTRLDISDLGAQYHFAGGNAEVKNIHAAVLGGTLAGDLTMRNVMGDSRSHLTATLKNVRAASLKQVLNSPQLQKVALNGAANADVDATWGKTFDDLSAKANVTVDASMASQATPGQAVPLTASLHATYSAPSGAITLANSFVRLPATSLILNGTVSKRSALQVRLQSSDLHQLEAVADIFRSAQPGAPAPQPLGLYGTASFNGTVRGTTSAPELAGNLNAQDLRVHGTAWRSLRTSIDVSPSFASLQNGELLGAKAGRITFNLRTALNHWAFTNASPFSVSANAGNLNVADLTHAAGMQTPVSGTLSLNVSAHGTELNPIGNGTLALNNAKVSGESIQSATLKFNGTGEQVNGSLKVSMPAGPVNAVFAYMPKTQGYDVNLQANGLKLDQLETVKARNLDLHGALTLIASGRGTIKDPQLTASLSIPQLTVQGQTISGINLQTEVANHAAQFTLDSQALNSGMHGQGTVQLTGDYYTTAKLDTQRIPLQPLVALYAPTQAANIAGATELHATIQGPLQNKQLLTAHVTIPTLQLSYKNKIQLGAAQPIHLDYANGVLALQRTGIKGTDTDLQLQASVPMVGSAPMSLVLQGTVDLQLAQLLSPDLQTSGQLVFDINSQGARTDQNVQGQVRVVNASFAGGAAPIGLQNGNGVLTLTNNRLDITQFTGTVGGGTLQASGGVVYRPSVQFDLALSGQGIRMLYPAGMREALDANLSLTGNMNAATLSGQVNLDQLSFTPDFDLMNFAGQFSGDVSAPSTGGFMDNLKLNIGLHSNGGVNLVSRTLSLQATANLDVRGTASEPVVLGRVNVSAGDLIFRGNRYILQGATLDFINPVRTQPVVNASVTTTIQQYNIEMRFWGPADHLHTNYASDPALPPADVINLLAFGTTTEASAANPNPPGNLGAESLIASQVSSQITSRVEKIAGISQLSIDPVLAGSGSGQNPGARVTIQQRVTSNLFVTFSTDVTSTQNQAIQLQYKLSPRTSFSATRDQNGGFGFDVKIKKSW